ncbi:hypothetical protein ABT256_27295 [Amycolatopsis japonica]|uniref:hypothetical protein n=1 Tax=Amycolatopsis japonica TaxID=208439 RepID=UPI00332C8A2B
MPGDGYSDADIEVLEFDESVIRWPGMYFGVSLDDPRLPTSIVRVVVDHAVHPAPHLAAPHRTVVEVEILGDLSFSITDDRFCSAERCRVPEHGYFGSLLGPDRWSSAAAAALSRRTVVEVWQDGRGLRQELAGMRPAGPPRHFTAPLGRGTTVMIELDPDHLGAGATIGTDLDALGRCHGDDCVAEVLRGVTVKDRRGELAE